jgi:hypothetical protein
VRVYVGTFEEEPRVRRTFEASLERSPLVATLRRAAPLDIRFEIVN